MERRDNIASTPVMPCFSTRRDKVSSSSKGILNHLSGRLASPMASPALLSPHWRARRESDRLPLRVSHLLGEFGARLGEVFISFRNKASRRAAICASSSLSNCGHPLYHFSRTG